MREGDVAAFLQLLPESYQKDINDVVSLFGYRMDAEVWETMRNLFVGLTEAAKIQKQLLIKICLETKIQNGMRLQSFMENFSRTVNRPKNQLLSFGMNTRTGRQSSENCGRLSSRSF